MDIRGDDKRKSAGGIGESRFRKCIFPALLGSAFVLFLLLRLRYLTAVPNYDEARFALIIRAFASGNSNELFHEFIFLHPPLYLAICRAGMAIFGESLNLYRLISLAFASGSFFVLYFLVKEASGRTVALFSCLALALMPAASSIDAWVKEDSLCVFFALCVMLAFMRRHFVWSGLFLGLCLLGKENAVMLFMILPVYLLLIREKRDAWRGFAVTTIIAVLASFWWYLFFSSSVGSFQEFFRGSSLIAKQFYHPWHFYFCGTTVDLGWPLLLLALWGGVRAVKAYMKGEDRRVILPVVWVLVCYMFLSVSNGKPFWMITIALPAWAWLAGLGFERMYGFFAVRGRALAAFAVAAILVAMLGVNLYQGGDHYIRIRGSNYHSLSIYSKVTAEAVNRIVPQDATLLVHIQGLDNNPLILYHLRSDIRYVVIPQEFLNEEGVMDILGLWSGERADACFFDLDEWGVWLAGFFQAQTGAELTRTPYGYILVTGP